MSDSTKKITVRNIDVTGLKRTDRSLIFLKLSINPGQQIAINNLLPTVEENRLILEQTALFGSVLSTVSNWENDSVDIVFTVKERWYIYAFPYAELADRNFSEWWIDYKHDLSRLVYGGAFYDYNFRGKREKLSLWALFGFNQLFELEFDHPPTAEKLIPGYNIDLKYKRSHDIAYQTLQNKLQYYTAKDYVKRYLQALFSLTIPETRYVNHIVKLSYYDYHIGDTVLALNPKFLAPNSSTARFIDVAYRLEVDKTNIPDLPEKGYRFSLELGKRGIGVFNDVDQYRWNMSFTQFFDLGKRFYAETSAKFGYFSPSGQPYFLSRAMGYDDNFVRGYELFVIDGHTHFLQKNTLRYNIVNIKLQGKKQGFFSSGLPLRLYLLTHADWGYVADNTKRNSSELANRPLSGYGFGIEMLTYYHINLSLIFSVNRLNEKGVYLHFNI